MDDFWAQSSVEWPLILSLVFGGCCSNVWALESVLKGYPRSGTFLTFAQFVYVVIQNISTQLEWNGWVPHFKKRQVPIKRWAVQVILFLGISLMNNYAFGLKIPVTLHIIFRSGGLCVSMLTGYLVAGRRYSIGQVASGLMITLGIVIATLSVPKAPKATSASTSGVSTSASNTEFFLGITLLSIALGLSALLGLYQEKTYAEYGRHWREALFYSHFLSLPLFLPFHADLNSTFRSMANSDPITLFTIPQPTLALFSLSDSVKSLPALFEVVFPSALFALALNVFTQGICVTGVNRLTAKVNSTTVNLVLTLRKAVSLGISVLYYGSGWNKGLAVGSGMVLLGIVMYTFAGTAQIKEEGLKKKQE